MRWVDGEPLSEQRLPVGVEAEHELVPRFTVWHLVGIGILLATALWLWLADRTRAEAFPVRVILSYVPTVSTWGPPQATGVAHLTFSEGDVRADFVDLPVLSEQERYALWLLASKTGQSLLLGTFNASALPVTHVDLLLPDAIPENGWDTVLLTVEPNPDSDGRPSDRRVLVGALPGTPVELELMPPALPQTGRGPALGGLLLLAINAALLGMLAASRSRRFRTATGGKG